MAKYLWLSLLVALFGLSFFKNSVVARKAELASLINLEPLSRPEVIRQNSREVIIVKVYSTYPFNNRNLIIVNAGFEDRVVEGMTVTADGNFLLGGVIGVSVRSSVVRTIFDKDFSLSVRIGEKEVDALLAGGQNPRLTLVEKTAEIKEGDLVFSVGGGFPYGLKIGQIGAINDRLVGSFKEAELQVPYMLSDLREAAIFAK